LGRAGVLRLAVSEEGIQVGGVAVTCVDGQLSI
jgi:predicted PhzF superfamily epimerase YddE/YHI9